jgi:high-affinity iron transporter
MKKIAWLLVLGSLTVGGWLWAAAPDYQGFINDVKSRLDKTEQLYAAKDIAGAREAVQMAYFEVFENLEGPIRINISAKKSYEMEAMFGEIRKLIGAGAAASEVKQKTDWLRGQLDEVLPELEGGHQLQGESHHDTYANSAVLPLWQDCFKRMESDMAEAVGAYQAGDYPTAQQKIQRTWFDNFKNSEMEISVRLHRSREQAADINQRFSKLVRFAGGGEPGGITAFGYEITRLQEDLAELLPNLPGPIFPPRCRRSTPPSAPPSRSMKRATQKARCWRCRMPISTTSRPPAWRTRSAPATRRSSCNWRVISRAWSD